MYQRVIIIGNLGRDPEMRYTADGTPVTSFTVATSRRWNDQSGQPQEKTVWFRVSAWRRLAETCNQYLSKGRQVLVEGELSEPKPFQGRDGQWRASLEVTAREIRFLGGRGEQGAPGPAGAGAGAESREEPPALDEEDIPF